MTATSFEHDYGPEGGIGISLYWKARDGWPRPLLKLRIGDKGGPYSGPCDSLPGGALGLAGLDFNLSDVLPVSIEYLWELREQPKMLAGLHQGSQSLGRRQVVFAIQIGGDLVLCRFGGDAGFAQGLGADAFTLGGQTDQ
jgi:hypothetical protein